MALVIKSYDPVQHQQRAKRRRQKRSEGRSTLAPRSAACVGSPPSSPLITGRRYPQDDESFVHLVNMDRTTDPYAGFPSFEECLEFCSRDEATVTSSYTPTLTNPLSYPDSGIDTGGDGSDSSCQDDGYRNHELRQKLLAAIATTTFHFESKTGREACNANASCSPAFTTVAKEENDFKFGSVEHARLPDTDITSSTASSIGTPSTTSPICQKRPRTNQGASNDSGDGAQDVGTRTIDLDGSTVMFRAEPSGMNLSQFEFQGHIALEPPTCDSSNTYHKHDRQDDQPSRALALTASSMMGSVTESSSVERMPVQATISSTRRSFSSGVSNVSRPSFTNVCHPSKRLKITSPSSEEAISTLINIQKLISGVLDKFNQEQTCGLIPDVSVESISDTIEVAVDRLGDDSSDDSSSTCSSYDSESESELTASQPPSLQHKSTQRRRWTQAEEMLLSRLKSAQKRNGMLSDCEIARKLRRTKSGVKQHWDIMEKAQKHR
ncbi:hypothetical protein FDENT_9620 [Fusarium denticulatum]|uniref:Myb-like domain-containing protein n=1 Tax=Fusarium denticulatum TaxID=48507 RepID=A0A8H5WZG2_9HYPO|nr:hypothetical protein FDENT_9620 [Fusarium denticulatum]